MTVSMGVSTMRPSKHDQPDGLILKTDKALYKAKQKGRNRVEFD
ncbi:diguanylate cyclase domain-containing protein [Niallia oryzisoli]